MPSWRIVEYDPDRFRVEQAPEPQSDEAAMPSNRIDFQSALQPVTQSINGMAPQQQPWRPQTREDVIAHVGPGWSERQLDYICERLNDRRSVVTAHSPSILRTFFPPHTWWPWQPNEGEHPNKWEEWTNLTPEQKLVRVLRYENEAGRMPESAKREVCAYWVTLTDERKLGYKQRYFDCVKTFINNNGATTYYLEDTLFDCRYIAHRRLHPFPYSYLHEMHFDAEGRRTEICEACAADHGVCTNCRRALINPTGPAGDQTMCPACTQAHIIMDYSTNPLRIIPVNLLPNTRYFGLELEVQVKDRTPAEVALEAKAHFKNFAITKRDGSVNNGFEICTIPAILKNHRKKWEEICQAPFWEKFILDGPRNENENIGLHVHVSRNTISKDHLGRFLYFWNSEHNRDFMQAIAGRTGNVYAAYLGQTFAYMKQKVEGNVSNTKYEVVNLRHPATIEIRAFNSTKQYARLMARLEFVQAGLAFSEQAGPRSLTSEKFRDWLSAKAPRHEFRFLTKEVESLVLPFASEREPMVISTPRPQRRQWPGMPASVTQQEYERWANLTCADIGLLHACFQCRAIMERIIRGCARRNNLPLAPPEEELIEPTYDPEPEEEEHP